MIRVAIITILAVSLYSEVVRGESVAGSFLRGFLGVVDGDRE